MLIDTAQVVHRLERVNLGVSADEERREAFVQGLIHHHPDLIPTAQIEPAFAPLIPVCQELATPAGYVDNLFLTPWGGVALAECKLFRNPQARREVVAQALDYARAIQGWHFDDLEGAVRKTLRRPDARLYDLVRDHTDLDEAQFADAVERNLRVGRILLLIVGEGIQEGVEALTEFLQLHAGLHVGVALVELSLWKLADGGTLVIPRVPMKTVIIERGIVTVDATSPARIIPPKAVVQEAKAGSPSRRVSLSEDDFFARMEERHPGLKDQLLAFVADVAEVGVTLEVGTTATLRWRPSSQTEASAGLIEVSGKVYFTNAYRSVARLTSVAAADAYLETIARAVVGQVRRYDKGGAEVLDSNGKGLEVARLLDHAGAWKAALAELVKNGGEDES